jgi:hypothetical protein
LAAKAPPNCGGRDEAMNHRQPDFQLRADRR